MAAAFLVSIFYSVDALYGERRDRSILFWKSMPVSDVTTVLAKASIPLFVLPMLSFLTQLHPIDHAAPQQHGLLAKRSQYFATVDPVAAISSVAHAAVSPHNRAHALVRTLLCMAAAGLSLGARAPFLWAIFAPLAIGIFEKSGVPFFALLRAHQQPLQWRVRCRRLHEWAPSPFIAANIRPIQSPGKQESATLSSIPG